MKKIGLVFLLTGASVFPVGAKFKKECALLYAPNYVSAPRCSRSAEAKVTLLRRAGIADFFFVTSDDCSGYVRKECLGVDRSETAHPLGTPSPTSLPSREVARVRPHRFKVSVGTNIDGALGKVPYSTESSHGIAYGARAFIKYPLTRNLELVAGPGFHKFSLTRDVIGTGALADPGMQVIHSTSYLSGTLNVGYLFNERTSNLLSAPEYWLHGGVEFLYPLSDTTQTTVTGASVDFEQKTYPAEKILLATLGPGLDYNFSPDFSVFGSLQLFYNLSSLKAPTFYGVRILISADFTLG